MDKAVAFIKSNAGQDVHIEQRTFALPPKIKSDIQKQSRQRFFRDRLHVWRITRGDSLLGYGMLDNVYGKTAPITFMTLFDTDGHILAATVLKYREPYGGQVQNKGWLNQFAGKGREAGFRVGADVSAISGATISVNAMARGIKKLSLLFPAIRASFEKRGKVKNDQN